MASLMDIKAIAEHKSTNYFLSCKASMKFLKEKAHIKGM